ncbi:hypothetical protein AS593_06605 [Caulobacter vibrioides]|nr:hypothetical protein AS593_06605 [Caulobacter vibrioides]
MTLARTPARILILAFAATGLAALLAHPKRPRLVWNTTASVPLGLYILTPGARPQVGQLVAAQPPPRLAHDLAVRGVLPLSVPLIKPVAALPGQTVCRAGDVISIDGRFTAKARLRDRHGRPLPVWAGCRRLGPEDYLLLNAARDDSYDARYFGALPVTSLLGTVRPLWLQPAPAPAADRPRPGHRRGAP